MKLKISITKEVYQATRNCGVSDYFSPGEHCAIAYALKDIFPNIQVRRTHIIGNIKIAHDQAKFIMDFDNLTSTPEKRLNLPEFSFEIEIPTELVDKISLTDLEKSLTVELVN